MFIGKYEIESTEKQGKDYVKDYYKQNTGAPESEIISTLLFKDLKTKKIGDLTELREKRCFPMIGELLQVLLKYNMKYDDLQFVLSRLEMSVKTNRIEAENILWGCQEENKDIVQTNVILLK